MKIRNVLLCCAGFVMLALGAVGLFLPVLPTTPFVLVASGCFASTPALHARIMRIPFVNAYIRNYRDREGIPKKTLFISLIFLWGMLALSAWHVNRVWVVWLLALVGISVTIHILWIAKPRRKRRKD